MTRKYIKRLIQGRILKEYVIGNILLGGRK